MEAREQAAGLKGGLGELSVFETCVETLNSLEQRLADAGKERWNCLSNVLERVERCANNLNEKTATAAVLVTRAGKSLGRLASNLTATRRVLVASLRLAMRSLADAGAGVECAVWEPAGGLIVTLDEARAGLS